MLEIIVAGGWTTVPLVALSVIACAIIVERLWFMRVESLVQKRWLASMWSALKNNQLSTQQVKAAMRDKGVTGRMVLALLQDAYTQQGLDDLFVLEAGQLKQNLHRFLNMLGTIAMLSPLLGLLGTVLGMIDVFADLVANNNSPTELSGGISQALISTAIGLIVAIPTTFFHRLFTRKAEYILVELEHQYLHMRDLRLDTHV